MALERQRLELTGSLEEQQRAKRTEELAQKSLRRMTNAGILRGFGAWQEQYEEAARQKRMLAAASARLARPKLVACFSLWSESWHAEAAQAAKGTDQLLAEERVRCAKLEEVIEKLQQKSEQDLAEAMEAQRVALERQRATLTGSLEEQAKEKRKEELSRKAAKRMGNQGILRGWTAWQEMWEEAARQKRMLAAAGARLAKPKLAACFSLWTASWLETEKLKSTKGIGQMLLDKEKECDTLQAEVASLTEELAAVRYAALSDAEKEKHDRVERLAQKSLRRMINAGFLRGWSAWHEKWEEAARQKRMLAAAGVRLARPQLVACFSMWCRSWMDEEQAAAAGKSDERVAEQRALNEQLRQEMHQLKRKHEEELAEAMAAQRTALERQKATLTGSLEEQAKEKRKEELSQKAAKRMQNQGILRGWTAWQEKWEEAARRKRMLKAAGQRLARPRLTACFSMWAQSWMSEDKLAANAEFVELLAEKDHEIETLRRDIAQARADLTGALEAQRKLGEELAMNDLAEAKAKWEAAAREARTDGLAQRAAKRMSNQGLIRAWAAWQEQSEEAARKKRMLAAAGTRLLKPKLVACFSTWTEKWLRSQKTTDAAGQQRLLEEAEARCEALEQEVERLRREHADQQAASVEAQRAAIEQAREEITKAVEAKERLRRREEVGMRAAKRLASQGLLRGWDTWQAHWEREARRKNKMAAAASRLTKPALLATFTYWREDWSNRAIAAERQAHAELTAKLRENAKLASEEQRATADATRITLEDCISDLEAELLQVMQKMDIKTIIPPKQPRYLVMHSISAKGVPDADAVGGSDPYVRVLLLDHDRPGGHEMAYTSFKRKQINPTWDDERLQFKLALGGKRPGEGMALRIEVRRERPPAPAPTRLSAHARPPRPRRPSRALRRRRCGTRTSTSPTTSSARATSSWSRATRGR